MESRPRCYIASPLGFSEAGRHYYAEVLLPALSDLVTPVDPWALVTAQELADAAQGGQEREFAQVIGTRNLEALKSSELLVAILDGQEIDSGTASEIGFASALGLPCFGLRTDQRKSGEPGATINLQVQAFISLTGGRIAASLDALLTDLRSFLSQRDSNGALAKTSERAPAGHP